MMPRYRVTLEFDYPHASNVTSWSWIKFLTRKGYFLDATGKDITNFTSNVEEIEPFIKDYSDKYVGDVVDLGSDAEI